MSVRRLLLLLKPSDAYPIVQSDGSSGIVNPRSLRHMESRQKVHSHAVNFCQDILRQKSLDWKLLFRDDLMEPIRNVDLVVTVGGDGTLLHASHFLDDSIPVLGINSDPTQPQEVQEFSNEFDASRSTGYLSGATLNTFEYVLDNICRGRTVPSELSRISLSVNSRPLTTYALNDILIAHPCPASVSRFSFKIQRDDQLRSTLVNSRSSGLRVSTATGSTAAMHSAGGSPMHVLSRDLQYMVREPISLGESSNLMHGLVKPDHSIQTTWYSTEGVIYVDGYHVCYSIKNGDVIEISSKAPTLKVFLPHHLLSTVEDKRQTGPVNFTVRTARDVCV